MTSISESSAIERFLPDLAVRLPSVAFGSWPTPTRQLEHLSRHAGVELWLKDDGQSSSSYGGNKVRKLELLLAAARAQGANRVITVGGLGSNHIVATGIHARRLGIQTAAVVAPQPITACVRKNVDLMRSAGVELWPCAHRATLPARLLALRAYHPDAFMIAAGGSSPLGTIGCFAAAFELAAQLRANALPAPDVVVIPLGSAGTLAGLILGLAHAGVSTQVIGFRVVELPLCNRLLVMTLVARTRALLAKHGFRVRTETPHALDGSQLGSGYGHPTKAALLACELAGGLEGLHLEPTYTGKALAGILSRKWARGTKVLFWNTHNTQEAKIADDSSNWSPLPAPVAALLSSGTA